MSSPRSRSRDRRHRSRSRDRHRRSRSRSPRRRSRSRDRATTNLPPPPPPLPPPPPAAPGDAPPPPLNSIHRAHVVGVRPFGVFVEVPGHRRHALVPPHQVAPGVTLTRDDSDDDKVRALSYFARPGESVWAKIVGLAPDPRGGGGVRVTASLRAVDQATGEDADPDGTIAAERPGGDGDGRRGRGGGGGGDARRGPPGDVRPTDDPPPLGVVRARVARVAPYGVHLWIEGYTGTALVHASHVSDHLVVDRDAPEGEKVAALAACVPSVGDDCYTKVVAVEPPTAEGAPPRVAASLKLADQRTGTDLDPHGLKWRPRGAGGDADASGGRPPVGAAAADRVAGDAVDWGHLAADTYGGGKTYELVVGGDSEGEQNAAAAAAVSPHHHSRRRHRSRSPTPVITSAEEALAILEKYGGGRRKEKKERRSRR